ncbi:DUF448 domain-containing protein [Desulfofustis limnaeus]|uniref:YlxR domain-containing protein n=1 Tax=Desulfofustis limnaeus TaxID=2740163 RepID=A0ABM7WA16_9BACT|nr:DUF448 domain-containing protein [Desulfofustis limnaeus]BDD87791.1 hypothetical protein DPPLL_21560 [Desulfofustis limnaeus]
MTRPAPRPPIRTCVSCGRKAAKQELLRHIWSELGPVADARQLLPGRGAYCCDRDECRNRLYKDSKRWKRLFRKT